jgi:adenosylcobinamide kinase/adenosylcobinamide-phosphate guanylyltransferase
VVTASEIGGGIVPIDPAQRKYREAAGRLCRLIAERSDTVIRVFCGIPTTIKGGLK